ncbi:UDP-N-acetylmuramoyl-tripeptide--D-alanyl-D-alanine ligase [Corynebacterium pseudodiphtheriticum]|uniref:UDP-N-acetylmuramoyl-tripeptide--D-alanyl-D- alanine ligase n=1 Tax=Corynebacterium pseudodiphtheriticum TaxID=37637 RepID=UPI002541CF16|nr:UDP-N-acetylmuramoyl-tripeptide--D-alanyl-D-alanine ligase [Corynebacterium pseudodiphtheriticum]MDK4321180.1 UDP-N-acetylmuramoyl-tripeptide--D-alanyl-D-alanine ligase [Corynebacterium pseudodiphtheriticum]
MIPLTIAEIAEIVGGRLDNVANPQAKVIGTVEFDSRQISPGSLFLALPGAKVDGHDFAEKAHAAGAVVTLAARPVGTPAIIVPSQAKAQAGSQAYVFAHDEDGSVRALLTALAKLARAVVTRLTSRWGLSVVGVTGSAGKTSTKDMVAALLSTAGPTVAPPGSFNNEIGHPYTALRCHEDTQFLVTELSARGLGHIAQLAEIAPPQIGAVLNVGTAHLGEFGSKDTIAQAKGELIEAVPEASAGGVAVLNADDPAVAQMATRTQGKIVTFSANGDTQADYYATDVRLNELARASFLLHSPEAQPVQIRLQVAGKHQIANALAAAAVAAAAGVPVKTIGTTLCDYVAVSAHRMDIRQRGANITIINDAYNANPESMRAGLAALAASAGTTTQLEDSGQAIAVLGEMSELGTDAVAAHRELGTQLAAYGVDTLVAVGKTDNIAALTEGAQEAGVGTHHVADVTGATRTVEEILGSAQRRVVVLVKASNAWRLWRVAEQLVNSEL